MFTRNCVIFAYRLSTETVHVRTRRHVTWQIISARHRASERTSCFLRACQLSWEHNSACVNNINRLLSFDVVVWVACPAGRGHCRVLSAPVVSHIHSWCTAQYCLLSAVDAAAAAAEVTWGCCVTSQIQGRCVWDPGQRAARRAELARCSTVP